MRTILMILVLFMLSISTRSQTDSSYVPEWEAIPITYEESAHELPEYTTGPNEEIEVKTLVMEQTQLYSEDDIELIALVTMAEAEAEPVEGQRLVIDSILNRIDSEYFPNSIDEVVYQKNQFSSVWNGRIDRCYVRDDIYQLVREEMANRTNYEVIFFRLDEYSIYGSPMFSVGSHYFSSYE